MPTRAFAFRLMCSAAATLLTASAAQASISYDVNQTIGGGTVVGQIQTDGTIGILSTANITAWNLQLNGVGASFTLTNTGGQSSNLVAGNDLTASATQLLFNYSATDGGYLLFERGLFGGAQYFCAANSSNVCYSNAVTVAPASVFDASAQHISQSGQVVIATAGAGSGTGAGSGSGTGSGTGAGAGAGAAPTSAAQDSVNNLADSRDGQMIGNNLRGQLLLGGNEQVSCGNCGGANAGIGSLSLSAHGRYALTDEWTVLGGVDFGHYRQREANVTSTVGLAAAIQFDPANMGSSRPYAEAGLTASSQETTYNRAYASNIGAAMGVGKAKNYDIGLFAEAGWVDRITPRDEAAGLSYV